MRPSLGHPNNKQELKKLTERESARQKETDGNTFGYENKMKEIETEGLKEFLRSIHEVTVQLISQFDTLVTLDDVIEGGNIWSHLTKLLRSRPELACD